MFTSVGPWMIGRDAAPVDVDGRPGWLSTDGAHTSLSWAVVDATYAYVRATDPDAALELARSLRWVSVEEWAQHYRVDVEAIEPGAAPVRF